VADFNEMPDLRITLSQAARFWSIDLRVAQNALARLMTLGYLECQSGIYRRA
jgi:hypothetical protein